LLALLDAVDQQSEPPPASLPPPPPTTSSTPPPPTTSIVYAAVPSVHPDVLSPPLVLSDLTNAPVDVATRHSRRCHSLKRKREMLHALDKAATEEERKEVMQQQGLSGRDVKRFRVQVESNASAPKGMRSPLTAKHRKGGGRKTILGRQQELELRHWVMSLRRSESRFRVTERMIQLKARERFRIKAGNKWVQGFMARHRLSLRRKTTTKEVTTARMQEIKRHYQNRHAELFATASWFNLFNMDETSVYRDAPGDRTVDEVGAKTVEIGSTQHDADRVAVVLCIDRAGSMIPPLIIHKCYEKKRFKKRHVFFLKSIPLDGGQQYNVWVTYANKSWLNGIIMRQWIDKVYMGHIRSHGVDVSQALLFMDNCSAHDNEGAMEAMAEAQVRCEFFPPNCTPILQPLDQNVNKMLKEEYEKRWEKWFIEVGSRQLTRGGNRKRATDDEVNGWVANSLHAISEHVVRMCWKRTMDAPPHVMRLPQKPWDIISSFLSGEVDGEHGVRLQPYLAAHRRRYDGSHFQFPAKQRRKRASETPLSLLPRLPPPSAPDDEDSDSDSEMPALVSPPARRPVLSTQLRLHPRFHPTAMLR
jgi:hypothetical protein